MGHNTTVTTPARIMDTTTMQQAVPASKRTSKPRLETSNITQVVHIPPEERKALNVEGPGGSEFLKKLDAIMNSTQTKIEMSPSQM